MYITLFLMLVSENDSSLFYVALYCLLADILNLPNLPDFLDLPKLSPDFPDLLDSIYSSDCLDILSMLI